MDKLLKKVCVVLVIALSIQVILPASSQAATVGINVKNKTMAVGQSYKLKIKGTKSRIVWKSSKSSVASVNSSGLVKAKKIGTANITATVNKKKYTCKIVVKSGFNASKAIKNIKCEYKSTPRGVVAILKNNNNYNVVLEGTMVFYDDNNQMLGKSTDENYCFEAGKQCALFFSAPASDEETGNSYIYYKTNYKLSAADNMISNTSSITVKSNIGMDNVMVETKNSGSNIFSSITIAIVFYKNGQPVGYDYSYADECLSPGGTSYIEFENPYDQSYETIDIDDYKIFVNYAYKYKF